MKALEQSMPNIIEYLTWLHLVLVITYSKLVIKQRYKIFFFVVTWMIIQTEHTHIYIERELLGGELTRPAGGLQLMECQLTHTQFLPP